MVSRHHSRGGGGVKWWRQMQVDLVIGQAGVKSGYWRSKWWGRYWGNAGTEGGQVVRHHVGGIGGRGQDVEGQVQAI